MKKLNKLVCSLVAFSILFSSTFGQAGVIYRGADSRFIEFVETISLGEDQVCTYSGKIRVEPEEVEIFIPENDLRKKVQRREAVIKRWEIIKRAENIGIYGPLDPISLYSDLIEETAGNQNDKFVGAAAMGLGFYIVATGMLSTVYKNLGYDIIPQKAGYFAGAARLAEMLGFVGPNKKSARVAFENLVDAPLMELLQEVYLGLMADRNVLKSQIMSLLISKSSTVLTVGFSVITFGLLVGNIEHPLFTTHKIRSILSNTLVVEADKDAIVRLNNTISEMPEDLTKSCPSPNDIYHKLSWRDFSYYDFKMSKFPDHKLNFKVIVDMIFRKLSPL